MDKSIEYSINAGPCEGLAAKESQELLWKILQNVKCSVLAIYGRMDVEWRASEMWHTNVGNWYEQFYRGQRVRYS